MRDITGVQIRMGSFCSGVAGLDMGVAAALEASHAWFSENDPGASTVLTHHFPDVPNHGDLTTADWSVVEPVDILCMGFPCQPFSAAGRQLGTADDRHLFPHIVAAMEKMPHLPRTVVIENVPRLVTIQDGQVWRYVQDELMRLGYAGAWRIAPAAAVGAPHLRKRVVLVAQLSDQPHMRHLPKKNLNAVALLPSPRVADATRGPEAADKGVTNRGGTDLVTAVARLLPTPRATDGTNGGPNQRGRRGDLAMPSAALINDFGRFNAAIERWAAVVGASPSPREIGPRGGERLSPRFVEWMVGLPAGFVTDVPGLSRNTQLRVLGNIVVPQFAQLMINELMTEIA